MLLLPLPGPLQGMVIARPTKNCYTAGSTPKLHCMVKVPEMKHHICVSL